MNNTKSAGGRYAGVRLARAARAARAAIFCLCAVLLAGGAARAQKVCILKHDAAEGYKNAVNPCDSAASPTDPSKTLIHFDWCGLSSYKVAAVYQQNGAAPAKLGYYNVKISYDLSYFSGLTCDFNPRGYFDAGIGELCVNSGVSTAYGAYMNNAVEWAQPYPRGVELYTVDFGAFYYDSDYPSVYPVISFKKTEVGDFDFNELSPAGMEANVVCDAPAFQVKAPDSAAVSALRNGDCSGANVVVTVTPSLKCLDLRVNPAAEVDCPASCDPGVSVYKVSPGGTETIALKAKATAFPDPTPRSLDTTYQYKVESVCTGPGVARRSPLPLLSVTPVCGAKFPVISGVTVNGAPAAAVMDQNSIVIGVGRDVEVRGKVSDEDSNVTAETVTLVYGNAGAAPVFPQYATATPDVSGNFSLTIPGEAVKTGENLYWALWATDTVVARAARFPAAYAGTRESAAYIDSNAIQVATPPPFIVDNQSGDDRWRGADSGAVYDVDFGAYISKVDKAQYTVWSGPGMTGSELAAWTDIAAGINSYRHSADWGVAFASLTEGMNYVSARAYDDGGLVSETGTDVFYIKKDSTPPGAVAAVYDGKAAGADVYYATAAGTLSANWSGGSDAESGLSGYQYAIGSSTGAIDALGWTDNASATAATKSGLTLTEGLTYYFSVRAVNGGGLPSAAAVSNGQNYNPPPGDVTNLSAVSGDNVVYLSWTKPAAADVAGTKIMRSASAYPQSATDGTLVYDGAATSAADTGAANGSTYYYTAFAYDGIQNFASGMESGARAIGVPSPGGIVIANGWNFAGASRQGAAINPAQAFASATGPYEIFGATSTPGLLTNYQTLSMTLTGAYWIYSSSNLGRISPGGTVLGGADSTINLVSGWNAFALPFDTVIPWDNAHAALTCGGSPAALPVVYSFENGAYSSVPPGAGFLSPWKGYWIKVAVACALKITK